jgi:pimeloyl-ACP methyl ester carboxylesterase
MEISVHHDTKILQKKRVLVISGKKDKLSDRKAIREQVGRAGVEYHEISDAGHLLNYERPKEVARRIKEFLAE